MLLMTMRSATKDHIEKIAKAEEDAEPTPPARTPGSSSFRFVHSNLSQNVVPRSKEAKMLAFVTKAIDSALEYNGTEQDSRIVV